VCLIFWPINRLDTDASCLFAWLQLQFVFDVMGFMQQLRRCSGRARFQVAPSTLQLAEEPSEEVQSLLESNLGLIGFYHDIPYDLIIFLVIITKGLTLLFRFRVPARHASSSPSTAPTRSKASTRRGSTPSAWAHRTARARAWWWSPRPPSTASRTA
jgi:hypothetical protein